MVERRCALVSDRSLTAVKAFEVATRTSRLFFWLSLENSLFVELLVREVGASRLQLPKRPVSLALRLSEFGIGVSNNFAEELFAFGVTAQTSRMPSESFRSVPPRQRG